MVTHISFSKIHKNQSHFYSIGAILSDRFVHILIGKKIAFLADIVKVAMFFLDLSSLYLIISDKTWIPNVDVLEKFKKTYPFGQILLYKIIIFGNFCLLFWLFLGHFWLDTSFVGCIFVMTT